MIVSDSYGSLGLRLTIDRADQSHAGRSDMHALVEPLFDRGADSLLSWDADEVRYSRFGLS